jgi:hypothetical protein
MKTMEKRVQRNVMWTHVLAVLGLVALISACGRQATPAPVAAVTLTSAWLSNEVVLDGKMTTQQEWSDATSLSLDLLEQDVGPATISSRWWLKNDGEWLYLLASVPASELEAWGAYVDYFWSEQSDISWVEQGGGAWDAHAYNPDSGTWTGDTDAASPGTNDVQGAAALEGSTYWFEFRKALNSGDGYDWSLTPGEEFGTGQTGTLYLGVTAQDVSVYYQVPVLLSLAAE